MEWPSRNVPPGGIFHSKKVQYSPETKQFLKLLIDESKLTNWQRNKVNYHLRTGEPFSPSAKPSTLKIYNVRIPEVVIRPGSPRRRSRSAIVESGAYEREKFVPDRSKIDREELKRRLQDAMAKNSKSDKSKLTQNARSKMVEEPVKYKNRFDELLQEIHERQVWLKEMEELGEAHKHRDIINLQIEEKLRELEKLKPGSGTGLSSSPKSSDRK